MKKISEKQLRMVTEVIALGLREKLTGIDPLIYSAAEQRREMRAYNKYKAACVDLLAEIKVNNVLGGGK